MYGASASCVTQSASLQSARPQGLSAIGRTRFVLVELNVVEQRYRVVLEVLEDVLPVTDVAMRHGASRQTVHTWLRRYREAGMAGLVDRSRRPPRCAHLGASSHRMKGTSILVERRYTG